jgi:SEC-C motif-containing protein
MDCPCGGKSFETCCAPFIKGEQSPKTAEELMRSRYTAYTQAEVEYIKNTTIPKDQKEFDLKAAESWAKESQWLGFELLAKEAGEASDDKGSIEFIARYKADGKIENHHELATFVKIKDVWFFEDGKVITQVVNKAPKVGRNEPCPCGSGKKYKKCCG